MPDGDVCSDENERSGSTGEYICPACLGDAVDRAKLHESGDWLYLHEDGRYCIEEGEDHD